MKIGELAARTGVSIRSLRYYDEQGLLTPVRRENGYREYSPFAEEQVRTIQLYLNLGLSTEQIASFLHCVLTSKEAFCKEVFPVYRQKLAEIEAQILQLQNIKANLEERMQSILDERETSEPED
ncbi:transcriptional regulator [Paenibacillus sp. J23TS9]|uniref:MerR family transcriptional regulator n=1 Tax=Paenibacillus sp. J23TS9 TaxID=2807193 RepID=UPI001B1CA17D|nr:MerR family transcriptional regulator [Paenibacillus sp. J23TS9]GIP25662.1 transcriptional regulator [Paenibacillus sp. J23TS9]